MQYHQSVGSNRDNRVAPACNSSHQQCTSTPDPAQSPLSTETLPAAPCTPKTAEPNSSGVRHWIKEAYIKHLGVTGSALRSMAVAFGVSTGTAALIDSANKSSAGASLIIVGISFLAYYGTFIPQLAWKDREYFRMDGKASASRVARKVGEYGFLILAQEAVTTPLRVGLMAGLIKFGGYTSNGANALSFIAINAFYMGILPPIRHALQSLFKSAGRTDPPSAGQT